MEFISSSIIKTTIAFITFDYRVGLLKVIVLLKIDIVIGYIC